MVFIRYFNQIFIFLFTYLYIHITIIIYITRLELLKNILEFIQGVLVELEQISQENFMKRLTGNWPSTNDNFNGPNKFDNGNSFRDSSFKYISK